MTTDSNIQMAATIQTATTIQIASTTKNLPSAKAFQHWVNTTIKDQRRQTEVCIRLVDHDEIQALNKQYRGKDKPTNVLAFPADFPKGVDIPFLGDIVICPAVIEKEASEQNKELNAHWAHIVIHGCLHLLGYDHIDSREAEVMETLETQLLSLLGYPCPY